MLALKRIWTGLLGLALSGVVFALPVHALTASFYTEKKILDDALDGSGGKGWNLGGQDVPASDVLAIDLDNVNPRTTDFGIRLTDRTYLSGRFTDFTNGKENVFECESFGPLKVGKEQVCSIYLGGYPGQMPELEAQGKQGVLLKTGEYTEGEVLYISDRYVGVKIASRIRKYNVSQLYVVVLKPMGPAGTSAASWQVLSQNGDMLWAEASDAGFKARIQNQDFALNMDRISGAEQVKRTLPLEVLKSDAAMFRYGRNGEGRMLELSAQSTLPQALWQRGPSSVGFKMPPGGRGVIFRAWREPGFYRGQMKLQVGSGGQTLQEINLMPNQRSWEGVAPLGAATQVSLSIAPGGDDSLGDRVIWQRFLVYK